jgi:hypothetical protein
VTTRVEGETKAQRKGKKREGGNSISKQARGEREK